MATRPYPSSGGSRGGPNWRAILRRSVKRSAELLGAALLIGGIVFTVLALLSYHQTDPSPSTAAGGPVLNWMGRPGAWVAERALIMFGPVSALLLPLMFVFARQLWRIAEADAADTQEEDPAPIASGCAPSRCWWWPWG
jgi:S-DNA-T family DNA segregation ATPase FtsK/SpoIIIE